MKGFQDVDVNGSTCFERLAVNPQTRVILARFKQTPDVRYKSNPLPQEKFNGLLAAESKGGYFIKNIRHDKTIHLEQF